MAFQKALKVNGKRFKANANFLLFSADTLRELLSN